MKKNILNVALYLIFIIIFNLLFFILKDTYTAAVWISYAFIHFAYIALITTQFFEENHKEVSLKLSSYLVSAIYFGIEIITGIIIIVITPETYKISLAIQITLLGIYLIILLSNIIVSSKVRRSLEEQEENFNYVKGVSSIIKTCMNGVSDENVAKKLEMFYDVVKYSPLKTNWAVSDLEKEIKQRVLILENNRHQLDNEEFTSEIEYLTNLANKRNIILQKYN